MREEIIQKAREWIGTPYHHHQSVKGVGVDCVGLIASVGIELGIEGDFNEISFRPYAGYSRNANPNHMLHGMQRFLVQVDEPQLGDIAWVEARQNIPCHLALKSGDNTVIHACAMAKKVVETHYPDRIHSWWRYGGLNE